MNLVNDISPYADEANKIYNVIIDFPMGSKNKYEYDHELGVFSLDRTFYHSMYSPTEYGFIPQTIAEDGDPVDVSVLVTHATFPGCHIKCRPIGILDTSDEAGHDPKIIMVPVEKLDPRWADVQDIDDLNDHVKEEIITYYAEYKRLEKKKYAQVKVATEYGNKAEAIRVIDAAIESFKNH